MARRRRDRKQAGGGRKPDPPPARAAARHATGREPSPQSRGADRSRRRVVLFAIALLLVIAAVAGVWRFRAGDGTAFAGQSEAGAAADPGVSEGTGARGEIPRVDDLTALDPAVATAIRDAVAAVEREPESGARWGELGVVYNAHRYYAQADRCYARATLLSPDTVDWPHLRGVLAEERGDAATAAALYRRALSIQPANRAARYRLGNVLLSTNDLEDAEAAYRELADKTPDEPWGALGLGRVEQRRGAHEAAAGWFERALALDPGNEQASHLLAGAYRELGRAERARQLAEGARDGVRSKSPADPIVDRVRGSLRNLQSLAASAREIANEGNVEQAEALYESILEVDPENFDALYGMALLEGRRQQYARAQALLEHALEIRPKSSEARMMLSVALSSQNQFEAARAELRKILENDPDNTLVQGMLLALGG